MCALRFVLIATAAGVVVFSFSGCKKKKPAAQPPPEVQVVTVNPTNVPIFEEWIGTLDGYVNAQIRAQVSGYLLTQNYSEGSEVKKGQLLFQIDPRPFQATLDQAKAKRAQDEAQLKKTGLDLERFTPLAKDQAISQEQLDDAVQANASAQAQIESDDANIETAALNLGFTKITSPIDGLAGVAQVQIGDLVGPSGAVLTTISRLNPIKVYFQVSEQSYLTYWKRFVNASTNDPTFHMQLLLSDGSLYPHEGKFFFAGRQVDINTGTLQIVGLFPNENYLLRPGQYARVRAQTQTKTNALLVPQRAISELQGSYQVAVVGESNKVNIITVKVAEQVGENWIVETGLKPGDRLVVEGTQKAKAGAVVTPKPWSPPKQENSGP